MLMCGDGVEGVIICVCMFCVLFRYVLRQAMYSPPQVNCLHVNNAIICATSNLFTCKQQHLATMLWYSGRTNEPSTVQGECKPDAVGGEDDSD